MVSLNITMTYLHDLKSNVYICNLINHLCAECFFFVFCKVTDKWLKDQITELKKGKEDAVLKVSELEKMVSLVSRGINDPLLHDLHLYSLGS